MYHQGVRPMAFVHTYLPTYISIPLPPQESDTSDPVELLCVRVCTKFESFLLFSDFAV